MLWQRPQIGKKWLILAVATSLIGAACGSPAGNSGIVDNFPKGPVVLTVWRPFDEGNGYLAAAESYHNQHPNVTINYRFIDPANFETNLINALANHTGPDIVSLNHDRIPAFADKLVPMPNSFFGGADLLNSLTSQYAPAVATDVVSAGKVYGIPLSTDSLVLYWNSGLTKHLFDDYTKAEKSFREELLLRPPADWDELVETVKLITARSGNTIDRAGIALGVSGNVPHTADIIAAMMLQYGVEMVTPDHRGATFHLAAADNPNFYPGAAVLNYLKGFVDPASDHYTWNADLPNALDAFIGEKTAMMISDRSVFTTIEQRNPTLNFRVSPLPQLPNAKTIVDYALYPVEAVTNNARYPDVAWDFLHSLATATYRIYDAAADRTPPVRDQPATTTVLQRTDLISGVFALQVPTAQSWFKGQDAAKADSLLTDALDRVSLHGQPARDSLNQAAAALTALLAAP